MRGKGSSGAVAEGVVSGVGNGGNKQGQRIKTTAQGQIGNLFRTETCRYLRCGGLDQWRSALNLDGVPHLSQFQFDAAYRPILANYDFYLFEKDRTEVLAPNPPLATASIT